MYTGKIYCGRCGSKFRRKVSGNKIYWGCYRHNAEKDQCASHQIPEAALTAATLRLHNKLVLHGQELLQSLLDQLREIRERDLRCLRRKMLEAADGDEQSQSTEAMLDYLETARCGGRMARGTRSHGRVGWQCRNLDCGQVVRISDETLAELVDGRLRKLAQSPHLLTAPELQRAAPTMDAIRLQNELTMALNRGSEKPEYLKTLALAVTAQRYEQLPDPTPAHELERLRAQLEQSLADAGTLANLLATAVRAVRLTPDKSVELELINGTIIAEKEAQSA